MSTPSGLRRAPFSSCSSATVPGTWPSVGRIESLGRAAGHREWHPYVPRAWKAREAWRPGPSLSEPGRTHTRAPASEELGSSSGCGAPTQEPRLSQGRKRRVPGGHLRERSGSRWRRRAEEEGGGGGHSWRRGWHPGWEPHVLGQPKSVVLFREGQGGQCTAGGPQGREMLPSSRLGSLLIDLRQVNRKETNLISYGSLKDTRL